MSIFSIIWLVSLARDVALIFPNFPSHPSALPVSTDLTYITYKMHQDGYKISQVENVEAMKIPNWLIRVQAKNMADKKSCQWKFLDREKESALVVLD